MLLAGVRSHFLCSDSGEAAKSGKLSLIKELEIITVYKYVGGKSINTHVFQSMTDGEKKAKQR